MEKFILDLHPGDTFEAILEISESRKKALTAAIDADLNATKPATQPEGLQIICKHCRTLNELVYYVFLSGKQFGAYEAFERGNGFMNFGPAPNGGVGLNIKLNQ
jgi:hypothetical protein